MRSWRRQVVRPTLMFSEAGVMVEASEDHMFAETSPPLMVGRYREIPPPRGAAVCAIQFVHTIGATFESLHTYKLHYYASQQAMGLLEDYLSPSSDGDLKMRAVSIGADSLNRDQRRVICSLLSKSDPDAWQASSTFRQLLEK
jgi:hypothetical protein